MLHPQLNWGKRVFEEAKEPLCKEGRLRMSKKPDEAHAQAYLKRMIEEKPKDEPVEEVLSTFCQRYSVSLKECKVYYNQLKERGEIKE